MKRLIGMLLILGLGLSGLGEVQGQDGEMDCPAIVEAALAATSAACTGMGRDQACYGHASIAAEPMPGVEGLVFAQAGDMANIAAIRALWLSGMDVNTGLWGVGLLRLRANLLETLPGEAVTLVLFGSVAVLRDETAGPEYGPMQAFYLTTALNDAPCREAPNSGVLIQTPAGAGTVTLRINAVTVTLGSTVYVQAQAGGELVIYVVEGTAWVEVFGVTREVSAGMVVRVLLDASGAAAGAPGEPEPYDAASLAALPVGLLPVQIAVAPVAGSIGPIASGPLDVSWCNNDLGGEIDVQAGVVLVAVMYPGGWNNAEDTAAMIPVTRVSMTVDGVPVASTGAGPVGRCIEGGVETCYNYPVYFAIGPLSVGDHVVEAVHDSPGGRPWWPDPNGPSDPMVHTEHCIVHARAPAALPVDSFDVGVCEFGWSQTGIDRLVAGQRVIIGQGCAWPTMEEAEAGKMAGGGVITIDGAPQPVYYTEPEFQPAEDIPGRRPLPDRYGVSVQTDWIATPGTHTVVGQMPPCEPHVCVFTVEP